MIRVIISSLKMLKLVFRELIRQFLRGHKAGTMAEAVFKALTYRLIITILRSDKSTRLIFWFCNLQAPYATPLKPTNKNRTPEPWSTCLGIKLKWLKTTPKNKKHLEARLTLLRFCTILCICVFEQLLKILHSACMRDQLFITPHIMKNSLVFWSTSRINLR